MKKILFLPSAYDGCYYYRGYLPGVYGGMSVINNFSSKKFNTEELYKKAMEADVIVFQRPNDHIKSELAVLLKQKGKKIVFDNDDTYLPDKGIPLSMLTSDKQKEIAQYMNDNLYKVINVADLVIASTDYLADEYRLVHDNVIVNQNCIDPNDEYKPKKNTTGKYRIGFVGSVTSNDDYVHIKDQIKLLAERGDITIVVFGVKNPDGSVYGAMNDDLEFWNSLPNIEWQPFVNIIEYYYTINKLALDLMVIPRKDNYFNRCKSNLKFLEASLLRIPVIAQGFEDGLSPYQVNKEDSEHMEIVIDNDTWYDKIVELLQDEHKRVKMSEFAHNYVLKNYNIKNNAPKLRAILENL